MVSFFLPDAWWRPLKQLVYSWNNQINHLVQLLGESSRVEAQLEQNTALGLGLRPGLSSLSRKQDPGPQKTGQGDSGPGLGAEGW